MVAFASPDDEIDMKTLRKNFAKLFRDELKTLDERIHMQYGKHVKICVDAVKELVKTSTPSTPSTSEETKPGQGDCLCTAPDYCLA